jgi:predicted aminopeptidase
MAHSRSLPVPLRGAIVMALLATLASGCQSLGYYAHVARGHAALTAARQPIARVVADPAQPPQVREQLAELVEARRFATERLQLPDNRSYRHYVALERPYVSWNVLATPELSLKPLLHCFPFAGCVPYRGWFEPERAEAYAARLRREGYETHVAGTPAYSTLGWFADPVVSTMLRPQPEALIGTVFHELTHQKLYLRGDAVFNESLAAFVEQQGLREWRARQGRGMLMAAPDYRPVVERVMALRERLEQVYAGPGDADAKRSAKAAAIDGFRADYARWRGGEGRDRSAYDAWVAEPIDNAKLLPFGLYDTWVPAFEVLFADSGEDWSRFHAAAAELAGLPAGDRRRALARLRDRQLAQAPEIGAATPAAAPSGEPLPP